MYIYVDAAAGYAPTHPGYYPFVIFQLSGRATIGVPPILEAKDVACKDCNTVHDYERCPLCGSYIFIYYGLTGGGCGTVYVCDSEACPWFYKVLDYPLTEE